jgi:hypothetical protein
MGRKVLRDSARSDDELNDFLNRAEAKAVYAHEKAQADKRLTPEEGEALRKRLFGITDA